MRSARTLASLACLSFCAVNSIAAWHSAKLSPFIVYSETNPKAARTCVVELEQLRFSLGELLGRKGLTIDPILEVFLSGEGQPGAVVTTRTGAPALLLSSGGLDANSKKLITRMLLEKNTGRMPPHLERGLTTFLSTAAIDGAHVVWGAPPPPADRDFDWALVDWMVTTPDTYGKFRVLLANLQNDVDEDVAYRNSIGKTPAQAKREIQAFLTSGHFPTIDAPSRPLSAERDITFRQQDPVDMNLHLADLLDNAAAGRYRDLLNSGVHKTEAEEGLALIARRAGQTDRAREFFEAAFRDGSKNAYALLQYSEMLSDSALARSVLEKAIAVDPNSGQAHFMLAKRLEDPAQQIQQLEMATKLAPREQSYWVQLAQTLQGQKRWSEAAKAWRNAGQAATTPEERDKLMAARLAIESLRLDDEDQKRKTEINAQQRETDRLKHDAWDKIHAAESRAADPDAKDMEAHAVAWDEIHPQPVHVEGTMVRVDCANGSTRSLTIRTDGGKLLKFNLDPKNAGSPALSCGAQSARPVAIDYVAKANARAGTAGEASLIQLR